MTSFLADQVIVIKFLLLAYTLICLNHILIMHRKRITLFLYFCITLKKKWLTSSESS